MSWLFSQALVEAYLADTCSGGEPSAQLKSNPTPHVYCSSDKMTDCSRRSRYGTTFGVLTESRGEELLTSYLAGFLARISAPQDEGQALMASEADCGRRCSESFARYDPDSRSWKTVQCSLFEGWDEFSETWPRQGIMRHGWCWEQTMWAHRMSAKECGFWPTPTVHGNNNRVELSLSAKAGDGLATAVRRRMWPTPTCGDSVLGYSGWTSKRPSGAKAALTLRDCVMSFPTPTCQDAKNNGAASQQARNSPPLNAVVGGALNPTWVEWLMGWPLGWTDLKPWGTGKCQRWRRWRSAFCTSV